MGNGGEVEGEGEWRWRSRARRRCIECGTSRGERFTRARIFEREESGRGGRRGGLSISTMEKPGFNDVRLKKMDRNIGECITRIGDWLHCNFCI